MPATTVHPPRARFVRNINAKIVTEIETVAKDETVIVRGTTISSSATKAEVADLANGAHTVGSARQAKNSGEDIAVIIGVSRDIAPSRLVDAARVLRDVRAVGRETPTRHGADRPGRAEGTGLLTLSIERRIGLCARRLLPRPPAPCITRMATRIRDLRHPTINIRCTG